MTTGVSDKMLEELGKLGSSVTAPVYLDESEYIVQYKRYKEMVSFSAKFRRCKLINFIWTLFFRLFQIMSMKGK